jgi:hypothetical protein
MSASKKIKILQTLKACENIWSRSIKKHTAEFVLKVELFLSESSVYII